MSEYSAKDYIHMQALSANLVATSKPVRVVLIAEVMAEGLMLPSQWWVRISVWFIKKRHGVGSFKAWVHLLMRVPRLADDLVAQTANWIVSGNDASGEGVGGFNQSEVNKLALLLNAIVLVAENAKLSKSNGVTSTDSTSTATRRNQHDEPSHTCRSVRGCDGGGSGA